MRDLNADAVALDHVDTQLEPGDVVGAYRIEGLRAEGGFAAVYRATHVDTSEPAAIKVLHARLLGRLSVIERFLLKKEDQPRARPEETESHLARFELD